MNNKLSILFVAPIYPKLANGIPSYIKWLADHFSAASKVTVLTPQLENTSDDSKNDESCIRMALPVPININSPLKSFARWLLTIPRVIYALKQIISINSVDVVHTTFHSYNYVFRILRRFGGPKYMVTLHGSETMFFEDIPWLHRKLAKWVIEGADAVVTVSKALESVAIEKFNVKSAIQTIPNGIQVLERALLEKDQLSVLLGVNLDRSYSLIVARLHPVKGVDVGIKAWSNVAKNMPDSQLIIVGGGELMDEYRKAIESLNIGHCVTLVGAKNNEIVHALMCYASLLIVPSRSEGLPISCLEAGLYSLPIVASKVGGIPELIDNGVNGFLVESEDHKGFAEKIMHLLENQELRQQFGEKYHNKIVSNYSTKKCVNLYLDVYQSLRTSKILQTKPN